MMGSSNITNNPNQNLALIDNRNTCKSTIKKTDNSDCKINTEITNVKWLIMIIKHQLLKTLAMLRKLCLQRKKQLKVL